ncbi:MAG: hypothetical protein HKN27_05385 [Silicimonas sp.]|nr:hypothetical protein [Silicimonas sp.]
MITRPKPVDGDPNHYAYVTVTGDGSLDELTTKIGHPPDEGWDKDDKPLRG